MRTPLGLLLIAALAGPALAKPKYYIVVRPVEVGDKAGDWSEVRAVSSELEGIFRTELGKRPEVTLSLPGTKEGSTEEEIAAALQQNSLRGFRMALKIVAVKKNVAEDAATKKNVLSRSIRLTVLGDAIPEKTLAIGGDGEGEVQMAIRGNEASEKESRELLLDAAKTAVEEAVKATLKKLDVAAKAAKPQKKKP